MEQFIGFDFGIIQYSDLVADTPGSHSFRLILLEKAVVAVALSQDVNVSLHTIAELRVTYVDFLSSRMTIMKYSNASNGPFHSLT